MAVLCESQRDVLPGVTLSRIMQALAFSRSLCVARAGLGVALKTFRVLFSADFASTVRSVCLKFTPVTFVTDYVVCDQVIEKSRKV